MDIVRFCKNFDWLLCVNALLLLSISVVIIYSATWGEEGASLEKVKIQMIAAGIGLVLIFVLGYCDYRSLKTYYLLLYVLTLILLVAVLIWGPTIRGTRAWFNLGPVRFQPSELSKIILIIVLANFFANYQEKINRVKSLLLAVLIIAPPVALIILEHDLGAALVIILVWFGMLVLAGLKWRYILVGLTLFLIVAVLAWSFFLAPYQKSRVLAFLNPERDPLGQSYNVIQSMIAVGSGGLWGKGLGHGSQSQLNFLPEQHTDFIFAVIAEEFGFLGGAIVLFLFTLLILRIFKIARLAQDKFGSFLGIGMGILFLTQVLINIGMNLGIVPVAGISLPLISYGGSVLVTFSLGLGILQSVFVKYRYSLFRRQIEQD